MYKPEQTYTCADKFSRVTPTENGADGLVTWRRKNMLLKIHNMRSGRAALNLAQQ